METNKYYNCFDCKYYRYKCCIHPFQEYCKDSSLWWPKESEDKSGNKSTGNKVSSKNME